MKINEKLREQIDQARKIFEKNSRFLLASHELTDGDDLGGMLALGKAFSDLGKHVSLIAKGGVPDSLLFLPGQVEVISELPADYLSYDVLVTLGCGDLSRPGFGELLNWSKEIINIDHHHDQKLFGTVNVWDEAKAANCEIVFFIFQEWGIEIDKAVALNLLTGIFTDTGGFRHANVSAQTFEIAAELLRRGAKLDLISRFTFSQKDLPQLRAWAKALENARFDANRQMVYTVMTEDDLKSAGATEDDLEGVAELLNTVPEARFSMLIKQRGGEIKGSLRSEPYKGVDVSEIARAFGGGGHKLAAGFKFKGKIEKSSEGWKIT